MTSSNRNILLDEALAFIAGALVPLIPLLESSKHLPTLILTAVLGGVTGLRLFRNTAFAENKAQNDSVSLASASKTTLLPFHPADPAISLLGTGKDVDASVVRTPPISSTSGYISPTAS